jgi:hypothetical protein
LIAKQNSRIDPPYSKTAPARDSHESEYVAACRLFCSDVKTAGFKLAFAGNLDFPHFDSVRIHSLAPALCIFVRLASLYFGWRLQSFREKRVIRARDVHDGQPLEDSD